MPGTVLAPEDATTKILHLFFLGGSQITEDGDYSHEIKRRLLFGRKAVTNLDSPHSQSYGFSSSHEAKKYYLVLLCLLKFQKHNSYKQYKLIRAFY